jgi:hypothetical protein
MLALSTSRLQRAFAQAFVDDDLGRGISMFCTGGLACYLVETITQRNVSRRLLAAIVVVALAAFIILKRTGARGYAGWFLMAVAFSCADRILPIKICH